MKNIKLILGVSILLLMGSCSNGEPINKTSNSFSENLDIVSWNVQTFFDAEFSGDEYSNFCDSSKWNQDKYLLRLERLCKVISELNADIYVLEEIENEKILFDISNKLSGNKWNSNNKWNYSCFAKKDGSSIGCAVLSKYELFDLSTHCIDIRTTLENQPDLRYLIQVSANINGKKIIILANHWKSKVGDEISSEIWRNFQESLLVLRLNEIKKKENCAVVVCGDFNKDISEFNLINEDNTFKVLLSGNYLNQNYEMSLDCGWFSDKMISLDSNGEKLIGSYYYKGVWEKIDNIFIYGNCSFLKFEPCINPIWCLENNIPNGYKIYTGEGFSDHLPIRAYLRF